MDTRSIAAAVAIGLAKMRSHSEKTTFDVMLSVKGVGKTYHWGVEVQGKCPVKCSA